MGEDSENYFVRKVSEFKHNFFLTQTQNIIKNNSDKHINIMINHLTY
jgi:hypothetical protein